jgi:hypothetical protein
MRSLVRSGLCVCVAFTLLLAAPALVAAASAQNPNPGVLPPQSKPFGASYGEWGSRWWQWVGRASAARNPVTDTDGRYCGEAQSGRVWFRAGTFGGRAERSCTVRPGTPLFIPIINAFQINDPPPALQATFEQNLVTARGFIDAPPGPGSTLTASAEIDGRALRQLNRYYAESPSAFTLTLREGNALGAPAGVYTMGAAVGIYLILAPLPPGQHTIHFMGAGGGASVSVTYHLTVSR